LPLLDQPEDAMTAFHKLWSVLFGKPLDPLDPRTRHAIAVTPLLAWVGRAGASKLVYKQ
jgi:hypothetical protein